MLFKNRDDAGVQLATKLEKYKNDPKSVVLGLARGGVVVAHAVAGALHLPLDVMVIRKVGAPDNEELAIGAIDEEGFGIFNDDIIEQLGIHAQYIKQEVEREKRVAEQRLALYRKGHKRVEVKGKTVLLVDDGIATGASIKAAIHALRQKGAGKIVLAVPVAPPDTLKRISKDVDETVCLFAPERFGAVGQFYFDFAQTSDQEVVQLLTSKRDAG